MIYLNHASISIPYSQTIKATEIFLAQWQCPTFKYAPFMLEKVATVKSKLARLFGAHEADFACVPNSALGVSMALNAHPFEPGDEIAFLDNEFPSNGYSYLAQASRGVIVRQLSAASFYQNPIAALDAAWTPRLRVLGVSLVGYMSGYCLDLETVSAWCVAKGVHLYVDATQGAGVVPIELHKTPVSVMVASGYKWLRWAPVMAFMYVHPSYISQLTPLQAGWLTSPQRPQTTYPLTLEWPQTAQKFEQGGFNILGLVGADAALSCVLEEGVDAIHAQLKQRVDRLLAELSRRKIQTMIPYAQHRAGIVTFCPPVQPDACFEFLTAREVFVTYRHGKIRLSPHYDTPLSDIEAFFNIYDDFISKYS